MHIRTISMHTLNETDKQKGPTQWGPLFVAMIV